MRSSSRRSRRRGGEDFGAGRGAILAAHQRTAVLGQWMARLNSDHAAYTFYVRIASVPFNRNPPPETSAFSPARRVL
jgi:hypothetical protein